MQTRQAPEVTQEKYRVYLDTERVFAGSLRECWAELDLYRRYEGGHLLDINVVDRYGFEVNRSGFRC